jgi:predicted dinucleotide-binding enzyme
MKLGIVGAGAIGTTLARVAVRCGHDVMISNARGGNTLQVVVSEIGCRAGVVADSAAFSDVLLVAIPFKAICQLEPALFAGKTVLDANNYYPARDGKVDSLNRHETTTSALLQAHLGQAAKVVKCFNAIMQRDIERDARPEGTRPRRALPIAADDPEAKLLAAELVNQFGFDPVDAGSLAESWRFERAMPAYCIGLDTAGLLAALAQAHRGVERLHGSWQKARGLFDPGA